MQDVLSAGVINVFHPTALTTRLPVAPHVVATGSETGRVVFDAAVPGAIPLNVTNFPNLVNIATCAFSIFELPLVGNSTNIYKLRMEVN
jgi:hypothetical protein